MKRHSTLVAVAIALGIVGWGQSSGVHADGIITTALQQTEPAVDSADDAVATSDDADAEAAPVEPPSGIEPFAVEDEPVPAAEDAQDSADSPVQGNGADGRSAPSDPSVRISDDGTEIELIRERYPNRTIKIEREVTQDAGGNYVNHGSWKMWDTLGSVIAEGQYQNGERVGVWNRWYRIIDVDLLKTAPYSSFTGPFVSQASFDAGRLNGKWTVYDSKQHKISEWEFVDGERQGNFTWWYPNGQKMRECHYDAGELNGKLLEWSPNSQLLTQETYEHGRKLGTRTEKYPGGGNKSEASYLFAREIVQTPDDWWNAKPAVYTKPGKDERHGHWVVWHPNGQKQNEGEYEHDIQVGKFTWWYANGQRALQGEYADGEQQGQWVWWHENGQKSIRGEYRQGHPIGQWTWWNNDGKVARASTLEEGAGEVVKTPPPPPKSSPPAPGSANRSSGATGPPRPSPIR